MNNSIQGFIFDYGEVISLAQDEDCVAKILDILKLHSKWEEFRRIYRSFRMDFDGGLLTGPAYWRKIATHFGLSCTEATLRELVNLDILSWVNVNQEMLSYIEFIKSRGYRLALLSNMPFEIMNYIKANCQWLGLFDHAVFSCELKICKPHPEIYAYCVRQMELKPEECVLVDDVAQNVVQATNYGIRGVPFKTLTQLKTRLSEYLR